MLFFHRRTTEHYRKRTDSDEAREQLEKQQAEYRLSREIIGGSIVLYARENFAG